MSDQSARALREQLLTNGSLRFSRTGASVVALQRALRDLGWDLTGTGYFGQKTLAAVKDFQRQAGLTADGIVGPLTAAELAEAIEVKGAAPPQRATPLWLTVGLQSLGLQEGLGSADNRFILEWAQAEGGRIAQDFGHDSIPWCALFVNHCLTAAGYPGTESLWALDFNSSKWPNQELPAPAVGAVVPMRRTGGGHVAILAGRNSAGDMICLGGNQSDRVSLAAFPLSRALSFRWPQAAAIPPMGWDTLPALRAGTSIKED